jgi:hypothetical protein
MTVLTCSFTGWMQIRLATNPDPTDEPRGVSGYTFALPGEADFDRILRTSNPVSPRTHAPPIGVFVRGVQLDGVDAGAHPLVGARVDLVGPTRFESVNEVVMEQGTQILEPFELALAKDGFHLQRRSYIDPGRPELTVYTAPRAKVLARAATFEYSTALMAEAVACTDPAQFRAARLAALQADYAQTTDATARAALERRIRELAITDPQDRRFYSMLFIEHRHFDLDGPTTLVDPGAWLPSLDTKAAFSCDIAMGSWDVDTLSFYAKGQLSLPL